MPPKEVVKKPPTAVLRPSISNSSLVYIAADAVEGFEERLEAGIDWTLRAKAIRYHEKLCAQKDLPTVTFSEALKTKIENSIFGSFLNEQSKLTLEQQWELILPITLWDNEMFANEEGKICFENTNNITDDMVKIIKRAVKVDDREILRNEIKLVNVLRVTDSKMTELDNGLVDFINVLSLNLCGNYIETFDGALISPQVRSVELQANRLKVVRGLEQHEMLYFGLARNCLHSGSLECFKSLPRSLTVLDLSDNDIYDLEAVLETLAHLPSLTSLMLVGNPCSVCMGYARITLARLPRLKWLDLRAVLPSDKSSDQFEPHPDDTRSAYFFFTIFRVMSAIQPPKSEKGVVAAFHIELELPLLDSKRRQFLMFRNNESLIEMLPPPEDYEFPSKMMSASIVTESKLIMDGETTPPSVSTHDSDIYKNLTVKNSLEIHNYTTIESNHVQWNKIMNFLEPTVKIFCPDLVALRNTFRTVVTIKLIYTLTSTAKPGKADKKSQHSIKPPTEQRVELATIRCALKSPDWSQNSQHFHWDDSLGTNDAIHWGEGDLSVLQYSQAPGKPTKGKPGEIVVESRQQPPDNLTCHFGFGIDTLK